MDYFKPGDRVWITYPESITADRAAEVVEDTEAAKVKVKWQTMRSTGRGRAVGSRDWREQSIPRERLKPRTA